jgi:hypothetical protein
LSSKKKCKDKDKKEQVKNSSSSSDNSGNEDDNKEPKEPDYDDEKSYKIGEEKQEQETGEITTNKVTDATFWFLAVMCKKNLSFSYSNTSDDCS